MVWTVFPPAYVGMYSRSISTLVNSKLWPQLMDMVSNEYDENQVLWYNMPIHLINLDTDSQFLSFFFGSPKPITDL